jgi:RNA polymerase sigma-70 factor, ECF subfamily
MNDAGEITRLLQAARTGDAEVQEDLIRRVYGELHRLAEQHLRQERRNHSLQPTALVNEAYIRLVGQQRCSWKDRGHFFATAARAMRNILVDYARRRNAGKRGAGAHPIDLDDALIFTDQKSADFLALEEALARLEHMDGGQCRIVELRFFGGFTVEEVAKLLDVSPRTVEREWELARRWLYAELAAGSLHGPRAMGAS